MDEYKLLSDMENLTEFVGGKIRIKGMVSDLPWQHLIGFQPGRQVRYFDIDDFQIVIYPEKEIPSGVPVIIGGTVIEVRGGGKGSKVDEEYAEYHIIVDWYEEMVL